MFLTRLLCIKVISDFQVHQIGKTTDESSYMIGRFNTDNNSDVSVQLFGQEIINLRKKDQMEYKNNKAENNRRYIDCAINIYTSYFRQ